MFLFRPLLWTPRVFAGTPATKVKGLKYPSPFAYKKQEWLVNMYRFHSSSFTLCAVVGSSFSSSLCRFTPLVLLLLPSWVFVLCLWFSCWWLLILCCWPYHTYFLCIVLLLLRCYCCCFSEWMIVLFWMLLILVWRYCFI